MDDARVEIPDAILRITEPAMWLVLKVSLMLAISLMALTAAAMSGRLEGEEAVFALAHRFGEYSYTFYCF
jgi:hypothetical protein